MMIIKNAKLITMEEKNYDNANILIRDGKIEVISELDISLEGAEIIDANGNFVFPGFIDAHCHLGMWEDSIGFEGADGNEMTNPITPELRAIDGINPQDRTFEEARNGGVTSCASGPGSANIIGGQFAAIKTYGNNIDDMIIKAPIAMKCAFGENPKRVYSEKKQMPYTRMAIASELRATLAKAFEYKAKLEAAKDDPSKKPTFDFKMMALQSLVNREIPLKAHAHRADDILTAIRIAKEFDLKLTLEHCTEGHLIVDILKEEGYPVVVGPSFGHRTKFELKNTSFETAGILANAGIEVAIMTDSPVIPLHHLPLCASYAVKAGMKEEDAMKSITITPAKILGLDEQIGSIREGKDADIVIWDRHPLDLMANVLYTIIDGKVVYKK
ncbi:MAG: amidohydrolase [Acidaminobacteraceae bacterium]